MASKQPSWFWIVFPLVAVLFFVAAEIATLYSKRRKPRHEVRTTGNILGNSGAALIALVFASPIGFFAAVSCALADTASSEIGLLSRKKPRLITSLKQVRAGTDGAVSKLGNAAAIAGAVAIALIHYALFQDLKAFGVIAFAGVFGMLVDSVLGASLQKQGILNNSNVNFLSCGIAAIAAALLYAYF